MRKKRLTKKRTPLYVLLLLSLALMFSCGKESKSPTGTPLEDAYTISGTVTGADSVTVNLSGDASASWTVKKSGESYSFTVATGGTYIVTASKSGYSFTPSDKTIKNLSANITQNFEAKLAAYTISGTVNGADSITVSLSGSSSATWMVKKSGGTYSFSVAAFGSYTITPTKKGYGFTPFNKTFDNMIVSGIQDFTAIPLEIFLSNYVSVMKSIPAGSFSMGQVSAAEPVHTVTLSAFEMSATEITQGQYKAVIGSNPSYFKGDDNLPVEQVSWYDAARFCNSLSVIAGLQPCYSGFSYVCDFSKDGFRLPTEAEWEYAFRSGSSTTYPVGEVENDMANTGWYSSNSGEKTHPVGMKSVNAWGLYIILPKNWTEE